MPKLNIIIDAGEKTCASEPGVFCRFVRSRVMESPRGYFCDLFKPDRQLQEKDGWLMRWQECHSAEAGT